jgi:RHS repeat-associated protein
LDSLSYTYDLAGNRSTEQIGSATTNFSYNALNQLTSADAGAGAEATYEWDAEQRLVAVNSGNESTHFTYDGLGRRVGIRKLVGGSEVSNRRFVWCDNEICEERTPSGAVSKRFFAQGMEIKSGSAPGVYFYTRDHLGSIRELIDINGEIKARYAYDPFGRRTHWGDMEADFGFAGMFWANEVSLYLTMLRAYEPNAGRWLSRDPLKNAEVEEGHNLYAYVHNDPVNFMDPLGLCCENERDAFWVADAQEVVICGLGAATAAASIPTGGLALLPALTLLSGCVFLAANVVRTFLAYERCLKKPCLECGK